MNDSEKLDLILDRLNTVGTLPIEARMLLDLMVPYQHRIKIHLTNPHDHVELSVTQGREGIVLRLIANYYTVWEHKLTVGEWKLTGA